MKVRSSLRVSKGNWWLPAVAAVALGPVERGIGVAEQVLRGAVRDGVSGNADASGDGVPLAKGVERGGEFADDALGHADGFAWGTQSFEQDGEAISAEAGEGNGLSAGQLRVGEPVATPRLASGAIWSCRGG